VALVKCKECGNEISESAKECPQCGYKPRKTSLLTWLVTIFIAIPFLIGIIINSSNQTTTPPTPETPEQIAVKKKKDEAIQRASIGAIALKKATREPEDFKLESAFVIENTGVVCYNYREKNEFGGVNIGSAVLSADGKQLKIYEETGFSKLWNKECANKPGTEAATAIRWFAL
jgi:hypothetical protein